MQGAQSRLTEAVLAGDRQLAARIAGAMGPEEPDQASAIAMDGVRRVISGTCSPEEAWSRMERARAAPSQSQCVRALVEVSSIVLGVLTQRIEAAQAATARLEGLLEGTEDAVLRTYCLSRGVALFVEASRGPEAALRIMESALATGAPPGCPARVLAHLLHAKLLLNANRPQEAEAALDEAMSHLASAQGLVRDHAYLFAVLRNSQGKYGEALRIVEDLREKESDAESRVLHPAWLLWTRAIALRGLGRLTEATRVLKELKEMEAAGITPFAGANRLEGSLALDGGDLARARELATAAISDASRAHVGASSLIRRHWALEILAAAELASRNAEAAKRVLMTADPSRDAPGLVLLWARLALLEGDFPGAVRHLLRCRLPEFWSDPTRWQGAHELTAHQLLQLVTAARNIRAEEGAEAPPPAQGSRPPHPTPAHSFVGVSPAAQQVRELIERLAPLDEPVLICGETGTGKEVVAQALHDCSPRSVHPFLAVNCARLTEGLVSSELFGLVQGAFVGAVDREGLFESAGQGTLLLDGLESTSHALQAMLLRAIETREIRRVGSDTYGEHQARVLVSASAPPQELLREGRIRPELYYRVSKFIIHIPPLRERAEDIPALMEHFTQRFGGRQDLPLNGRLAGELEKRRWPGNARELRNEIERLVVLSGYPLSFPTVPESDTDGPPPEHPLPDGLPPPHSATGLNLKNANVRRRFILSLFRQYGRLTQGEIVRVVGCAPKTASTDLRSLVDEGLILRVDTSPHPRTSYFVLGGTTASVPARPSGDPHLPGGGDSADPS